MLRNYPVLDATCKSPLKVILQVRFLNLPIKEGNTYRICGAEGAPLCCSPEVGRAPSRPAVSGHIGIRGPDQADRNLKVSGTGVRVLLEDPRSDWAGGGAPLLSYRKGWLFPVLNGLACVTKPTGKQHSTQK
ncbi:hypothetical protein CDAR_548451 [Caerostris darwini]|uniref:Uncharacterized protein n=1 Tax=Caerostris darwini TaxID=1538125 RepID=A0AAV4WM11_9ARAC|nr:hypothetical protein CDAR_548451 [Caerostris darwini]